MLRSYRIIAIPGLGADPEYTWKKDKVHWLRDANMLPKKIPHAKISVFQYQSQWFGKGSVDERIDNVANKLLHGLDRSRVMGFRMPLNCSLLTLRRMKPRYPSSSSLTV